MYRKGWGLICQLREKTINTGVIQNLILENRGKLSISGVNDVLSFDDQVVIVETELDCLQLKAKILE